MFIKIKIFKFSKNLFRIYSIKNHKIDSIYIKNKVNTKYHSYLSLIFFFFD